MIGKAGLSIFDKFVLWCNYLACAALLISYLAPYIDPRKIWIVAFFGLAYPPIFVVNLLFVLYWAFRRRLWFLLSLVCMVLNWNVLNSNIGLRWPVTTPKIQDSATLRVMNYNVHSFRKTGNEWNVFTMSECLQVIRHQQPSILCMQEFATQVKGGYDMSDSVKDAIKGKYYYFANFPPPQGRLGMAVFSKYRITNKGVVLINKKQSINQCIYADLDMYGQPLRVYVVHFQSIKLDEVDYRYLDSVSKKGKTDMQSNKRIGAKLKLAFVKRAAQVDLVKAHMKQCPYPYIVSGDFNDTPSSYAVHEISKGLKNAFREKGSGLGRTYNGSFPNYQIDYIMASKQFDVLSYGVVKKKLSDHYPVYSDIRLRVESLDQSR